ncbi:MAG: hypothetical protein IJJ25_03370 [Lachnospiraceae bacterium]|nr:hypothetical protein [Lachnospiraceae bacterium]
MKRVTLRRSGAQLFPVMILLLCLLVIPGARPAMAGTKQYMKKLKGISWDLKTNGKTTTFKTKYAGIGMHSCKVKITKWKNQLTPTDAKVLSFRITLDPQWKMTKSQVHKIVKSGHYKSTGEIGGLCGYYIVDYDTGENLEVIGNSAGVEVYDSGWHVKKSKTYRDNHGHKVKLNTYYTDVTVTYYPGDVLAVGVAGSTALKPTGGDRKFANGKKPFGKTSYFSKKNKKIAHFKKVQ